jgi:hypothetical protein
VRPASGTRQRHGTIQMVSLKGRKNDRFRLQEFIHFVGLREIEAKIAVTAITLVSVEPLRICRPDRAVCPRN